MLNETGENKTFYLVFVPYLLHLLRGKMAKVCNKCKSFLSDEKDNGENNCHVHDGTDILILNC